MYQRHARTEGREALRAADNGRRIAVEPQKASIGRGRPQDGLGMPGSANRPIQKTRSGARIEERHRFVKKDGNNTFSAAGTQF